jgi:lipoprotein-anchoring transpeptidase ErfK/SrfK
MLETLFAFAVLASPTVPVPVAFETARPAAPEIAVRARPQGPIVAVLGARTEFGSPLVFGVGARQGRWVGVITPALPNGQLGWVDQSKLQVTPARYTITVDLSSLKLTLRRGGTVVRRVPIGDGMASSPTPTGTFSVTDKLKGNATYGCCILALSGHQPNLPPGWRGGNRLAIHGGSIGRGVSAGCVRAPEDDLRALMAVVPLGTPVKIQR